MSHHSCITLRTTFLRRGFSELRSSLNILQKETEVQAASHLELADRMRNVLEKQSDEFCQKQVQHRLTVQANIGKKLKHRQTQETFATRAREKCENDRSRINSYTQQLNYTAPGPDTLRLESKLARTRETAKANEKDFLAFTETVAELLAEWQTEWKIFCDSCHDLEEDRMEFMKDNLWLYANEVSTLCVSDDQVGSGLSLQRPCRVNVIDSLAKEYERHLTNSSRNAMFSNSRKNMHPGTSCLNLQACLLILVILQ